MFVIQDLFLLTDYFQLYYFCDCAGAVGQAHICVCLLDCHTRLQSKNNHHIVDFRFMIRSRNLVNVCSSNILVNKTARLFSDFTHLVSTISLSRNVWTYFWRTSICLSFVLKALLSEKEIAALLSTWIVIGFGKLIPIWSAVYDKCENSKVALPAA